MTGYVYDRQGYVYYLASVGVATSDGAGNLTGSETMSFDGTVLKRKYTGTYTINADCTGSVTLQYADNSVLHGDIVILNDAKEVNLVQTDSAFVFSGVLKKQRTQTPTTTPPSPPPPQ